VSFSGNKFAFNKGSYKSQCAYMLMLIRQKDMKAWTKFKEEFTQVDDDETYEFYEKLVAFYRGEKIAEKKQVEMTPTAPIVKKKVAVKVKEDKKPAKKKTAKKVAKKDEEKVTKKKVAKKVTKKPDAEKTTKKKVAKKVTKKATAEKVTKKKVSKKATKK
jgi:hypothetical protein